jgi:hypothetical protein
MNKPGDKITSAGFSATVGPSGKLIGKTYDSSSPIAMRKWASMNSATGGQGAFASGDRPSTTIGGYFDRAAEKTAEADSNDAMRLTTKALATSGRWQEEAAAHHTAGLAHEKAAESQRKAGNSSRAGKHDTDAEKEFATERGIIAAKKGGK